MFDEKSNKRLPHFTEYLKQAAANDPLQNREVWGAISGVVFLGGTGVVGYLLAQRFGWPLAIAGAAIVAMPILGVALAKFDEWIRKPRNETERRKIEVFAAVMQFQALSEKRKLHKQLDPVAGQLLDAAAYYWMQIHQTFANTLWTHENLGGHWKALRDQALSAADMAMEDLVLLCVSCIGKPQKNRGADLKEAFEDLVELDFVDAIQNLRNVATDDWMKYAHRSPNLSAVFGPAREIAEKLKLLSKEVESMTRRAETAPESPHRTLTSSSSAIDILLSEMRATQQAEKELDQQQHLGQQ